MPDPVVVRIAPSPTGDPHVGTAYTCLFNLALRRKRGGRLILRIDDTDRTRYRPESEAAILRELAWLGLSWDEGPDVGGPNAPYRQSERTERYREACEKLVASGAAYRCDCTAERLDEVRAAQRARKEQPRYDGHCRSRDVPASADHVVRLKVPPEGETAFHDGLRGRIAMENRTIDDQVLLKSDGFPTYHLATVVDDLAMGITDVMRAEEWINSTPKHVLLYRALRADPPRYWHLPLLRNPDRSKISKRKNPTSITWYREHGFLPEALLNFLALMGYSLGDDRERFTLDEFVEAFEPEQIKTSGPIFDLTKLEWLNGVYIRSLSDDDLAARLGTIYPDFAQIAPDRLRASIPLVKERLKRLDEYRDLAGFLFEGDVEAPLEMLVPKKRSPAETAQALRRGLEVIQGAQDVARLEEGLRALAEEIGFKPRELFMALRVAVSGKEVTPPIVESLALLGPADCRHRIERAARRLEEGA